VSDRRYKSLSGASCGGRYFAAPNQPADVKLRYLLVPLAAFGLAWVGASLYFVRQVRTYEPMSHDAPFTDPAQIVEYGLEGKRTPADFGFPDFSVVRYATAPDALSLEAWWMPAERLDAEAAVLFVHGRSANRLKPMKYLPLLREAGLAQTHHVLLPDLRNSGASDPGATAMGWEFAEDVVSSMEYLAARGIRRVTFYAFSMGALATAVAFEREELRARIEATGLTVERIVFDSPLADVAATLRSVGARDGIPGPLLTTALKSFDVSIRGNLNRLTIAGFVADPPAPLLLLQGTEDEITFFPIFEQTVEGASDQVQVETFEGARHVKILTDPAHRERYARLVTDFLRPSAPPATLSAELRTSADD
jgi:pimeloyl-ACP methyl ester carboxylesterase